MMPSLTVPPSFLLNFDRVAIRVAYYKAFAKTQLSVLIRNHARRNKVRFGRAEVLAIRLAGNPFRGVRTAKSFADALTKALNSLPERYRIVLILRDVQPLSIAETSQVLGISEANVKMGLCRARLQTRDA